MNSRQKSKPREIDGDIEVLVYAEDAGTYTLKVSLEALEDFASRRHISGGSMAIFMEAFPDIIDIADKIHAQTRRPANVLVSTKDLNG
jgi:hypothetical protein